MKLLTLIGAILALTTVSVAQNTAVSNRLLNLKEEALSAQKTAALIQPNALQQVNNSVNLQLIGVTESKIGKHYLYQQFVNNTPIYGAYLKVNTNAMGDFLNSYSSMVTANDLELDDANLNGQTFWVVNENKLTKVQANTNNYLFTLKQADGSILFEKDTRLFFTDTTIKAMVFNPDPLTTAGVTYGTNSTYRNFNDSDYALINNQRVWVNIPAQFDNGTFYLQNKYAKIADFATPNFAPSTSTTDTFLFTRKQNGFKEVMALYHISALQNYLQTLGYNNLVNYQLRVDAQSSMADQSFFNYDPDTTLNFGLGGVPDAEDADVIIHEYTHAIVFSLNPFGSIGKERRAMEEAICDAMSCAYSKRLNPFRWKNVFNWDGNNEFWAGRNGASTKTYLDKVDDYYSDSEIWSSTINNLTERLGEDVTLKLVLAIIPQLTPYSTMPQAAHLMYDADSILNNGNNRWLLAQEFNNRKFDAFPTGLTDALIANQNISVINTSAFANGTGSASIKLTQFEVFDAVIYNTAGQQISVIKTTKELTLNPADYNSGMYLIKLTNSNGVGSYIKVMKF